MPNLLPALTGAGGWVLILAVSTAFSEDDLQLATPLLGQCNQLPFDLRRKIAQHRFVRWVNAEGRRSQNESRRSWRNFGAGKIAAALECGTRYGGRCCGLAIGIQRAYANPIVESLQRQVQVFSSFQFQNH